MAIRLVEVKVETRVQIRNAKTGKFERINSRKAQKITATFRGKKFSLTTRITKAKRKFLTNSIDSWFERNFNKDKAKFFNQPVNFDKRKVKFKRTNLVKANFSIFKPTFRPGKLRYQTFRTVGYNIHDYVKSEYLRTVLNVQNYGIENDFINWFFGIRLHVNINGEKAVFPAYTPIFGDMSISVVSVEKWVDKTFAALNGIFELLQESDPNVEIIKLRAQITLEK